MGKRVSLSDPEADNTGLARGMGVIAFPPKPSCALDLPTSRACFLLQTVVWGQNGTRQKSSGATLGLSSHLSPHVLYDFRPSHSPSLAHNYPT